MEMAVSVSCIQGAPWAWGAGGGNTGTGKEHLQGAYSLEEGVGTLQITHTSLGGGGGRQGLPENRRCDQRGGGEAPHGGAHRGPRI